MTTFDLTNDDSGTDDEQRLTKEEAREWLFAQGQYGEQYYREALHMNVYYFDQFDSLEELKADFEKAVNNR